MARPDGMAHLSFMSMSPEIPEQIPLFLFCASAILAIPCLISAFPFICVLVF